MISSKSSRSAFDREYNFIVATNSWLLFDRYVTMKMMKKKNNSYRILMAFGCILSHQLCNIELGERVKILKVYALIIAWCVAIAIDVNYDDVMNIEQNNVTYISISDLFIEDVGIISRKFASFSHSTSDRKAKWRNHYTYITHIRYI